MQFGNGIWYEVARANHIAEEGGQCSYAEYTPKGEYFGVKNYHVEEGVLKEIEGYAKAASEAGKMIHSLPYGGNKFLKVVCFSFWQLLYVIDSLEHRFYLQMIILKLTNVLFIEIKQFNR